MQKPNVPRHDDISMKLDIGVLFDISYPLISSSVRWKSWNLSKFYVPDYRLIKKILSVIMIGFAYYIYSIVLNCIQKSFGLDYIAWYRM